MQHCVHVSAAVTLNYISADFIRALGSIRHFATMLKSLKSFQEISGAILLLSYKSHICALAAWMLLKRRTNIVIVA